MPETHADCSLKVQLSALAFWRFAPRKNKHDTKNAKNIEYDNFERLFIHYFLNALIKISITTAPRSVPAIMTTKPSQEVKKAPAFATTSCEKLTGIVIVEVEPGSTCAKARNGSKPDNDKIVRESFFICIACRENHALSWGQAQAVSGSKERPLSPRWRELLLPATPRLRDKTDKLMDNVKGEGDARG